MIFLDTSVLIAGTQAHHLHYSPSKEVLLSLHAESAAFSAHSLAELYSGLTSIPPRTSPATAMQSIEAYLARIQLVALSESEYIAVVRKTAQAGHAGGAIYDALHLACARKINADRIYTWNLKHFRALAPDLADKIMTP